MSEDKGRASFVMSDDMRVYFNNIGVKTSRKRGESKTGQFPALIHPFYLSMIMGISKRKMAEPQPMKESMIDEWASDARSYEEELDGLGFYLHCRSLGLVDDQADNRILDEMKSFFEGEAKYTNEGYAMMNKYAQGGFQIILDRIPDTRDLADWLSLYLKILEE